MVAVTWLVAASITDRLLLPSLTAKHAYLIAIRADRVTTDQQIRETTDKRAHYVTARRSTVPERAAKETPPADQHVELLLTEGKGGFVCANLCHL
jgi:hypothetical protein